MPERPGYIPEEFRYRPEDLEKKGEGQFMTQRIESPKDSRVQEVQTLLERTFTEDEMDDISILRKAMKDEDEPYMVFATQNEKGEVVGAQTAASLHLRDEDGEALENGERVLYGAYAVIPEEHRRQGHGGVLKRYAALEAVLDAEQKEGKMTGYVNEATASSEAFHNSFEVNGGMRRLYFQNKQGAWVEAPYQQIPLKWDEETGEPTSKGAWEHLMYVPLDRNTDTISGEKLAQIVQTLDLYNMWYKEDFANKGAYARHEEEVQKYIDAFTDAVAGKQFRLISQAEREEMRGAGTVFHENQEGKPVATKNEGAGSATK